MSGATGISCSYRGLGRPCIKDEGHDGNHVMELTREEVLAALQTPIPSDAPRCGGCGRPVNRALPHGRLKGVYHHLACRP